MLEKQIFFYSYTHICLVQNKGGQLIFMCKEISWLKLRTCVIASSIYTLSYSALRCGFLARSENQGLLGSLNRLIIGPYTLRCWVFRVIYKNSIYFYLTYRGNIFHRRRLLDIRSSLPNQFR